MAKRKAKAKRKTRDAGVIETQEPIVETQPNPEVFERVPHWRTCPACDKRWMDDGISLAAVRVQRDPDVFRCRACGYRWEVSI